MELVSLERAARDEFIKQIEERLTSPSSILAENKKNLFQVQGKRPGQASFGALVLIAVFLPN